MGPQLAIIRTVVARFEWREEYGRVNISGQPEWCVLRISFQGSVLVLFLDILLLLVCFFFCLGGLIVCSIYCFPKMPWTLLPTCTSICNNMFSTDVLQCLLEWGSCLSLVLGLIR